ncbi:MAG: 3-hydroxyacyl-CoA dehydrogenase family protein [Solirubrobacterales bacterium]|nr:3-hydroxyacyl-CoA dehydrogenase family protein [Solirubrobacterales bacterium]MBV9714266.1 3-hydroxyacyl-CoA dehydrogenase family protein [Solirubrobacterales bacterium]
MPEAPLDDITRRPMAVIGAGTLGRRIALMLATRGGEVRIFDIAGDQRAAAIGFVERELPGLIERLPGASPGSVEAASDLGSAVAGTWLVIEALPERLELKRQVFTELDRLSPSDAILATNSSSYPSGELIDGVSRRERVLNTHFYMPPVSIAVEVMSCGHTDERVIDLLMQTLPAYGLVPFRVRSESVGFIYNRIWAAIKREALAVVAEGVATPAEVDSIFELSLGARRGPFRAMDDVGLDVVLDIEEHYAAVRDGIPDSPRQLLRQYVDRGWLGVKRGRGFYDDYGDGAT